MVEHLVDGLIQLLLVLLRLVGERVAGHAAPYQSLSVGVIIKDERSYQIIFDLSRSFATAAPSPAAHAIIERLVFLLVLRAAYRGYGNIAGVVDALPSLGLKILIDGALNTILPKHVFRLRSAPI